MNIYLLYFAFSNSYQLLANYFLVFFVNASIFTAELSSGDISRIAAMYSCGKSRYGVRNIDESSEYQRNSVEIDDEDDMILSKEQENALYSKNSLKRNGLKSVFKQWPAGLVPFEIDTSFSK
jgi:hypothetical protein